jgi:hypothetical protein
MMLILAITAAAVACVHLAVSGYVLEEPTNMEFDHAGLKETVFHSLAELLRDAKSCTLLGGVALSAAVLALHATLMPHYLGGPGIAQDAPFAPNESIARMTMCLAILTAGVATDAIGERLAICGMIIAVVMNVLGLRSVVEGHDAGQAFATSIGLCASQGGVGGYLGLALPMLLRQGCGYSVLRAMPAAAVIAAAINVMWLLGDACGVALQMVLSPLFGPTQTILAFAILLTLFASMALVVPRQSAALEKASLGSFCRLH